MSGLNYDQIEQGEIRKKERRSDTGVGMASVLMIVMVLAFTTFGILSLVSAQADTRMSEKTEEMTRAYYEAEGRLEEKLAALDSRLALGTAWFGESGLLRLTEEVQEDLRLELILEEPEEGSGNRYEIVSCRLINSRSWTPDEAMDLWDGGM